LEVLPKLLDILYRKFGGSVNDKGFKVLDKHIRLIQGDGVNMNSIKQIVDLFEKNQYSTDNITFGSGGKLLSLDIICPKFAIKCSYVEVDGVGLAVAKDPITDPGKRNKPGRLKLVKTDNGSYQTLSSIAHKDEYDKADDELVTVYENGQLLREYSFTEIRAKCDIDVDHLDPTHFM